MRSGGCNGGPSMPLNWVVPGGRWGTDAVYAGLRRLTDRWPGGTIGNEAEVYSGYYTEASSVSQPY
jgi:hypothetical protein